MRPQPLAELGFVTPPAVAEIVPAGVVHATISEERFDFLDADLLVWLADEGRESVEALPLRSGLRAVRDGREVFADPLLTPAFSHGTLLSLPYALDRMVPMIEAAVDGDLGTAVPRE